MGARTIIALLAALVLMVSTVVFAFAADCKGTVTAIEGNRIVVKDFKGKETTVEVDTRDIKVGDAVEVRDGKVTKGGGRKKKAVEGC